MPSAPLTRCAEASQLKKSTCRFVIGVDEAGRGPLCGPVVAAACLILGDDEKDKLIEGIRDSKKITSEVERELIYEHLVSAKTTGIFWGVSIVSHEQIDKLNIREASLLAMRLATEDLLRKLPRGGVQGSDCLALIDGNDVPINMPTKEARAIVKGDSLIYSIAAASVIAKVTRDRIMNDYAKLYPGFQLEKHKGYPTMQHRMVLWTHGPTPIHRQTYAPVKAAREHHLKEALAQSNEKTPSPKKGKSANCCGSANGSASPVALFTRKRRADVTEESSPRPRAVLPRKVRKPL